MKTISLTLQATSKVPFFPTIIREFDVDQQTLELAIRGELNHQRGHLQRLKRMFGLQ